MNKTSFTEVALDGRKVFFNKWEVQNSKITIALVHGMGEHSGRYDAFAQYFNENEISVLAMDIFGHGNTEGKKGHTSKMDDYLWQIDLLINVTKQQFKDNKIVLYGHSMGGCLVLNALFKRNLDVSAIIASAPAIRPGFKVPMLKLIIGKIGRFIMPSITQPNGLDVNGLSNDPKVIEAYLADPLVHDLVSAEVGMGLLEWGVWLEKNAKKTPLPLLIMHGSEDKLTSFASSEKFVENLEGDATFKAWKGLKHEIHNEAEKVEVLSFAKKWIESKI